MFVAIVVIIADRRDARRTAQRVFEKFAVLLVFCTVYESEPQGWRDADSWFPSLAWGELALGFPDPGPGRRPFKGSLY